jgi:hypothetical protein
MASERCPKEIPITHFLNTFHSSGLVESPLVIPNLLPFLYSVPGMITSYFAGVFGLCVLGKNKIGYNFQFYDESIRLKIV